MKTIKAQELTLEAFSRYGTFADMIHPDGDITGVPGSIIEFYRDRLAVTAPGEVTGMSVTKMKKRPFVIAKAEYHDNCCEACMPLNGDVYIHVAPATPHGVVPYDRFEVFRVPMGTMVVLRPGVWHHAPFAIDQDSVSNLCVLPERTYARDCAVVVFPEEEQMEIV